MTALRGASSLTVPSADVDLSDVDIFAVPVAYGWSREGVAALGGRGVRAVLPLVLAPATATLDDLDELVAFAASWGVPRRSSLCVDLTLYPGKTLDAVVRVVQACAHFHYWPWVFAQWHKLDAVAGAAVRRWVENVSGSEDGVPAGFDACYDQPGPFDMTYHLFRPGLPMSTPDMSGAGVVNLRPAAPPVTETAFLVKGSQCWYVCPAALDRATPVSEAEASALQRAGYRVLLHAPASLVDRVAQ